MPYKCNDCGKIFLEEDFKRLYTYYEGYPLPYKEICPVCEGVYFVIVETCEECGESVKEYEIHNGICESCLKQTFTEQMGEAYLFDSEQEEDFYLGNYFGSKFDISTAKISTDLICLTKREFFKDNRAKELLWDWIAQDIEDYAKWYSEFIKKRR